MLSSLWLGIRLLPLERFSDGRRRWRVLPARKLFLPPKTRARRWPKQCSLAPLRWPTQHSLATPSVACTVERRKHEQKSYATVFLFVLLPRRPLRPSSSSSSSSSTSSSSSSLSSIVLLPPFLGVLFLLLLLLLLFVLRPPLPPPRPSS